MTYATPQDLINRLGSKTVIELSNPNTRATEVNTDVVMAAIRDGQGLVDSYIGQRVVLPLEQVPYFIQTLTLDLAVYYLHSHAMSNGKDSPARKLYDDAIRHLERFAKGETSLGLNIPDDKGDEDATATASSTNHAEITSQPRRNSRSTLGKLT